jgi:ABC-2 type transport system permease protein
MSNEKRDENINNNEQNNEIKNNEINSNKKKKIEDFEGNSFTCTIKNIWTIAKKDLLSIFYSPIAYIVLTAFLILNGYIFWLILTVLNNPAAPAQPAMQIFFGRTLFYWLYILFIVPAITMRLIAEERNSGSIEGLMTAPVTDFEVIIGKYVAAFLFYTFLWLTTFLYVIILKIYAPTVDFGPILTGYFGTLLIGSSLLAFGVLTSTFTNNQIVAAIFSFAIIVILFSLGLLNHVTQSEFLKSVVQYTNMIEHMSDFGQGIIDTRHLIYYFSLTFLALFFSVRVLETRKWR